MLQRLNIEGFRSLKNIQWTSANLNVLIGPNGSGKSNLLSFLDLLSASARGELGRFIQRQGGITPLLWDGAVPEIDCSLFFSPRKGATDPDPLLYSLLLKKLGNTGSFRIQNENLVYCERVSGPDLVDRRQGDPEYSLQGQTQNRLPVRREEVSDEESLLSMATSAIGLERAIPRFREYVASWSIHHPINVGIDSAVRQPNVARQDARLDSDGQNLISVLHTHYSSRQFKEDIDLAMKAAFGDEYEELVFPPASDQRIQMRIRWKSLKREQSTENLSDGTLRFLFLITALANPSPAPLVAIDEPETGLHPSMLPIVAEFAIEASRHTQVIFTTHSAQFLDAFAETPPQTTVCKCEHGATSFHTIQGDELTHWLQEFSLGALFRSGELEGALISPSLDPSPLDK